MERNVVVAVADRGRDRDDLARGPGFGRGDRGADPGMIGLAQLPHHEPDAPPPPNEPPPPEKPPPPKPPPPPQLPPPKPPPPPQPPRRDPRLSSLRPHSTIHGLIPPRCER